MRVLSLFFTVMFTALFSFSQEFSVKYEMSMESTEPEIQAQLGMMQGSTMQVFSSGNKSRIETSMGGLMTTTVINDKDKNKGVLLMSGMLGKLAAPFNGDEFDAEQDTGDFDFELINETKKILGHTCKKAIVYGEEEGEMIYWYTEEIQPKSGSMGQFVRNEVPGLPLEIEIKQPEMTIKFVANEFNTKLKKAGKLFDVSVPEGYTETSFEKLKGLTQGSM